VLMYSWEAVPGRPVRQSGIHDDRQQAKGAAAAALLSEPSADTVTVTEVWPPATLFGRYYPTGRTWTGRRDGSRVAWTAARACPGELAS
jgi:hypothetical protein